MGRLLVPLSLLVLAVAAVYGTPVPRGGVPSVGSEWGPVRTHVGYMRTVDGKHLYMYSDTDVVHHKLIDSEIFDDGTEMEEYMQSKMSDETELESDLTRLHQADLPQLQGGHSILSLRGR